MYVVQLKTQHLILIVLIVIENIWRIKFFSYRLDQLQQLGEILYS